MHIQTSNSHNTQFSRVLSTSSHELCMHLLCVSYVCKQNSISAQRPWHRYVFFLHFNISFHYFSNHGLSSSKSLQTVPSYVTYTRLKWSLAFLQLFLCLIFFFLPSFFVFALCFTSGMTVNFNLSSQLSIIYKGSWSYIFLFLSFFV